MNKTFILSLFILVLLSGCSKQTFYFSKTATEGNSYQKKRASENIPDSTEAVQTKTSAFKADSLIYAANSNLEQVSKKNISKEAKAVAHYLATTNNTEINSATETKEDAGLKHIFKKKLYKQGLADEKPANKKGKAGFILSFVGLGLVLFSPLFAPILAISFLASVAGIIFSAIGLSEIRKNPDQYGNKNKAKAGLIMGSAAVALTLIIIILTILVFLLLAATIGNIMIGIYGN